MATSGAPMPNLERIIDELSKLTVAEATELSKMLKKRWGSVEGPELFDARKRTRTEPLGRGESLFEAARCAAERSRSNTATDPATHGRDAAPRLAGFETS